MQGARRGKKCNREEVAETARGPAPNQWKKPNGELKEEEVRRRRKDWKSKKAKQKTIKVTC